MKIVLFILLYVPLFEISIKTINYVISKIKKSYPIPKINYENGVADESKTMVVIPTILGNKERVKELFKNIENYYLANEDKNFHYLEIAQHLKKKWKSLMKKS